MEDQKKSKQELLEEIRALRQRVTELETAEAQRERTEKALQAAKGYAETLINSALDIIISVDADRRIVEFNPAAERAFGYSRAEVIGQPIELVYINPEESTRINARIAAEGKFIGEVTNRRKNGEPFFCYLSAVVLPGGNGKAAGVMGISCDITARKHAEETQARLTAILDATPDFVGICNVNGRALYINRAGRKMVGVGEDEPISNTYIYDYHPEWVRILFSEILPIALREEAWCGETALLHRDGHEIPVSQVILTHKAADGTIEFFSTIIRDISARKAIERQRAEFVAMLTHDIKNPLSAILGYVDLLHDETDGKRSPDADDFLQRLKDNALTIYSLIANYLDLARVEAGSLILHRTSEALDRILYRVVEQYGAVARRYHLSLTVDMQKNLPFVFADALALERVFSNLVRNALKFTPENGQVTVSARQWAPEQEQKIVVEVRDTGPGIAPEVLPTLFERYRRAPSANQHEGTGLGLFIVKTLAEAHGGQVEIESQLGVGTCVRVLLPAHSPQLHALDSGKICPDAQSLPRPSAV